MWFHKNNQCLYDIIQPHPTLSHPNLRPSCSALEKIGSQVMGYNDLAKMVGVFNHGTTEKGSVSYKVLYPRVIKKNDVKEGIKLVIMPLDTKTHLTENQLE